MVARAFPALKRWAKFDRPYGTGTGETPGLRSLSWCRNLKAERGKRQVLRSPPPASKSGLLGAPVAQDDRVILRGRARISTALTLFLIVSTGPLS